ncbi:LOW QUALITY PROTEIN: mesothelin-like protein [Prionailurus viverrinus]|uniref:LOW QUALITY PROTEIN: mesothelin-like protein n=1 Tax=Prionailurus viverrinus TaxID=61388 RepID=UPI001FF1C040|nr:LOW QUALITY PROTEIN: mesothelin-like protein [Prionailurus viverrinus]
MAHSVPGPQVSPGLALLMWFTAHCSCPQAQGFSQGGLDASRTDLWASADASLLHSFWCQPASQLPRDQLSALIRAMATRRVLLRAWQLSCLANLAALHGLQDDFELHPPDLLLFYNLTQVREADCRAFTHRAAQGDTELLANLPDQRAALQRVALACLGGPRLRLSASDLLLLGVLVCDMDASSIVAADPRVLQNLQRCHRLTAPQQAALNTLLASGETTLGPPGSWNLEGLRALGPLATYISSSLWMQVQQVGCSGVGGCPAGCGQGEGRPAGLPPATPLGTGVPSPSLPQAFHPWGGRRNQGPLPAPGQGMESVCPLCQAVGLDFFGSTVATYRAGRLSQQDARRFVTGFLKAKAESVSSRPKRGTATGRPCLRGDITAATLRDDLFLVHYDCVQLESCLGSRVLKANLDPLLQHPLPAECQRVVKAKLARVYPRGVPEEQLPLIASLVYLYSRSEIGQWNVTSRDTVVALLASDVALENQTEAVLQKYLDHNGTLTGALLVAIGGSRLCWMSARQIQAIRPSEFRAGKTCSTPRPARPSAAPGPWLPITASCVLTLVRPCPVCSSPSPEARRPSPLTTARPPGGAPVEELRHLVQANVSMDIDTFTNLNPRVLQSLSVGNVTTLLGQNVGDLQKARSHPTISSWLRSLNRSALGELGLDTDPGGLSGPGRSTTVTPNTAPRGPYPAPTSGLPRHSAPASGSPPAHLGYLPLSVALPSGLLWLLYWGTPGLSQDCSWDTRTMASEDGAAPAPRAGKRGLVAGVHHVRHSRGPQDWSPPTSSSQDRELE